MTKQVIHKTADPKYPTKDHCPDIRTHTKCPSGYVQWFDWAEKMNSTHNQIRCPTCGFLSIWVPKSKKKKVKK